MENYIIVIVIIIVIIIILVFNKKETSKTYPLVTSNDLLSFPQNLALTKNGNLIIQCADNTWKQLSKDLNALSKKMIVTDHNILILDDSGQLKSVTISQTSINPSILKIVTPVMFTDMVINYNISTVFFLGIDGNIYYSDDGGTTITKYTLLGTKIIDSITCCWDKLYCLTTEGYLYSIIVDTGIVETPNGINVGNGFKLVSGGNQLEVDLSTNSSISRRIVAIKDSNAYYFVNGYFVLISNNVKAAAAIYMGSIIVKNDNNLVLNYDNYTTVPILTFSEKTPVNSNRIKIVVGIPNSKGSIVTFPILITYDEILFRYVVKVDNKGCSVVLMTELEHNISSCYPF